MIPVTNYPFQTVCVSQVESPPLEHQPGTQINYSSSDNAGDMPIMRPISIVP
jgi:hypothetical protein